MTVELGTIIGVGSLIVAILAYWLKTKDVQSKRKNDIKADAKETAKINVVLGFIQQGIEDIKISLKANEKNINSLDQRVTRVEESTKQAHHRINKIEGE